VVVVAPGSVALLPDTVHNVGDALTAVPLAGAFLLGRRAPTARLTYGYGRTEDLAALPVLAIILFSAVYAGYEALARLAGNEWVAVYRLRTGRRIGSAALVADGHHARIDGFTSLAVVAGAIGVALGLRLADPIVGLAIPVVILENRLDVQKRSASVCLKGLSPRSSRRSATRPGALAGCRAWPRCAPAGSGTRSAPTCAWWPQGPPWSRPIGLRAR
jgi:divalent metal cation (Fe/Co/Zn/Cd) transporter